jgi:hypothetical protein
MIENRFPAAFAKKNFIPNKYLRGPKFACFHFRNKPVGLGKGSHMVARTLLYLRTRLYLEPL